MVSTWRGSKPGLTLRSSHKLRTMRPAPINRTSERATSETTSSPRVLLPLESELPRLWPCFIDIGSRETQGGDETGEDTGDNGEQKGEGEHLCVEHNFHEMRDSVAEDFDDQGKDK